MVQQYKLLLIICIFLLFSCSAKQKIQYKANTSSNSSATEQGNKYDPVLVTKHLYRNLSNNFDVQVFLKRFNNVDEVHDSCIVKVILLDKITAMVFDTISLTSNFYYRNYFLDSTKILSYSKKVNINNQVSDNYFGDLIIADLNFDNKDDIAIINDSGGNGGPFYSFYLQDDNKKMALDNFLTNSMEYFPEIKKVTKTIATYAHAGACCIGENVYYFDRANKKWIHKSHKIIGPHKE